MDGLRIRLGGGVQQPEAMGQLRMAEALAGGAQSGRVSVTAVCYAYGVDESGSQSVLPMGLFINTTDLKVMADGGTALHTDIKVVPPNGR